MKRLTILLAALLMVPLVRAQQGNFTKVTSQQFVVQPAGAPTAVGSLAASPAQPGTSTIYGWIVSTNSAGSVLAGPWVFSGMPTPSSTVPIEFTWQPFADTSSYALLITSSLTPPTGACGCQINSGSTGLTYFKWIGGYQSYTVPALMSDVTLQNSGDSVMATSINGVLNAALYPGADIGAKINAAIAALPGGCGTVAVPSGNYADATTVIKPRCVIIAGQSAGMNGGGIGTPEGTILNWTPTTGVAIAVGDGDGVNAYPGGGIRDLTINGPGGSNTAVGLWLGGDPAAVVLPAADYAESQDVRSVRISGFGTGVEWGNNAWIERFYDDAIFANGVGVNAATGITNSSEQNTFIADDIFNNAGAAIAANVDFHFVSTSFDFNGAPSVGAVYVDCHFEQNSGLFINDEGATIIGGYAFLDASTGTDPALFEASGPAVAEWYISGLYVGSNHTVSEVLDWQLPSQSKLFISDLVGNGGQEIKAPVSSNFTWTEGSYVNAMLYGSWASPAYFGGSLETDSATINDFISAGGYNLELQDDSNGSDANPKKYLRVNGAAGDFQVVNNAFSAAILDLSDAGNLAWGGGASIPSSSDVELAGANGSSRGTIAISAATSGSHTFGTAYSAAPTCGASLAGTTPPATAISYAVSSTTTAVTITLSASGTATFNWSCGPAVN